MIKYPLYVTLDTNIFDANKLDFSQDSTLGLLVNHVKAGKIKIVLSNIVLKEVEKHIIKASDGVCSSFRGLRKELINGVSDKFLEEIYKIATYGKVNEERVSIIKEKNGEYLVSTNDCKIGEKLKLDRVDKYAYEGWLNSNIVKLDEEKQVIK